MGPAENEQPRPTLASAKPREHSGIGAEMILPPAGRTRELGYCNLSPSGEFDKITSQAPVATTFILVTGVSFAYENKMWVSCNS